MNNENHSTSTDEVHEVIKMLIKTFDKHILTLSEDQIDGIVEEIHHFAEDKVEEFTILAPLLVHCDEKRLYYFVKKQQRCDYDYLRHVILWLMVVLILGSLWGYLFIYYDLGYRKKLDLLIQELKQYGVTVTKNGKGFSFMRTYFLDVLVDKNFDENDYHVAHDLVEQASKIHSDIYGWIQWSTIIPGFFTWVALCAFFEYGRKFFRPRYKEYHEQWCLLEYKLGQRKEEVLEEIDNGFI